MIKPSISIKGKISSTVNLSGKTDASIIIVEPELEEIEIVPKAEQQELISKKDGFSKVVVAGDKDLKPENIKKDISIFGIKGINVDTSDADATSYDIKRGKTAYVNNRKITGTMSDYNAIIEGNLMKGNTTGSVLARTYIMYLIRELPNDITISGTSAQYMFHYCTGLKIVPELDTSNIVDMQGMFGNCTSLQTIPLLDTSKVTNMNEMFSGCILLETVPLLDTSKVTNMQSMFQSCKSLETIPLLDTSKVTNMSAMFMSCTLLETIPLLDTNKVTVMNNMFQDCESLTIVPKLDTSKVTTMLATFLKCKLLTEIPQIDTSNVTTMQSMFQSCTSLKTVPLLDTSNVTTMQYMFQSCTSLKTVPLLDTSKVTNMANMFYGCTSLEAVPCFKSTGWIYASNIYRMFTDCINLSNESLNNILLMCINAKNILSPGNLKAMGLTSTQAGICTTLSNYQAFLDAGWKTGY